MPVVFKPLTFTAALAMSLCFSSPLLAESVGEAKIKQLIDEAKSESAHLFKSGRIANSNMYYGSFCTASNFGVAFLVRVENGKEPLVYKRDEGCISNISWRDIDGDGVPEIKLNARGGGSGVSHTMAVFYRWGANDPAPVETIEFLEYGYESWDGIYYAYEFEPTEWHPFNIYTESFLPVGAKCPNQDECEIKTRKTFCIEKCDEEVPRSITTHKDWPKFLKALELDGYEPANKKIATAPPEVNAEMQAAFDSWLSE